MDTIINFTVPHIGQPAGIPCVTSSVVKHRWMTALAGCFVTAALDWHVVFDTGIQGFTLNI